MGKRVFLVRHAKALKREEWKGNDCERPLTEKGKEEFREFLNWLKPVFPKRAKIVSSPCERALKTAQMLSDLFGYDLKVENSLMPDAEPEDYERVLAKHRGNLILVGHEPDLSLFLNYITCISPSRLAFKKGAVAELRKSKGVWKLFAFYNPSSL